MSEQQTADQRAADVQPEEITQLIHLLHSAFVWRHTPEGFDYWQSVCENLANKVGKRLDDY